MSSVIVGAGSGMGRAIAAAIGPQHGPVGLIARRPAALASLADTFFGHPSQKLTLIGITGTNGKTTTAYMVESILNRAGFNVGVIGTINYRYNQQAFDNPVTTPESLDLQRILGEMKTAGVSHVVMEVSSHALHQDRVWGLDYEWIKGQFDREERPDLDEVYMQATLALYLDERRARDEIPVLRMIFEATENVRSRAQRARCRALASAATRRALSTGDRSRPRNSRASSVSGDRTRSS